MKNERVKSQHTLALYETDGMLHEFEATVIACDKTENGYGVILDRTAFFPEGGGQPGDEGKLIIEDGIEIPVSDTQTNDNGDIIHYVDKAITSGAKVVGIVNKEIRVPRMQNHGAEHLLCGLIYEQFGYDNVGFHMSKEGVIFNVSGPLTKEQLEQIELRANKVIYEDVPITIAFPTADEAMEMEYRSKLDTYEDIRIVNIKGYDICACCAPQLSSTGQIGLIKIIDSMPHRGGTRITMLAGRDAFDYVLMLHDSNSKIMALLSSKRGDTAEAVSEFMERDLKLREELKSIKLEMNKLIGEAVIESIKNRKDGDKTTEVIFTSALDNVGLRNLINDCTEMFDGIVAGFIGDDENGYRYIIGCSGEYDIKALSALLNSEFAGKGGGNSQMVQGSIFGKKEKIIDICKNYK